MPNDKNELIAQKAKIDSQLREMALPIAKKALSAVESVDAVQLSELAVEARGVCDDVATQIDHFLTCLNGLRVVANMRLAPPEDMPMAPAPLIANDQEK